MTIHGKVAEILDKYTVVGNIGKEDGVEEGMKFEVYEEGPVVKDPDTGDTLGQPETVKIKVVVKEVEDKMSIMETDNKAYSLSLGIGNSVTKSLLESTKQEKMKTDDSVKENRKKVVVGDLLREVISEDEDSK